MADYILVNGARIEREFFDENVAEARECKWTASEVPATAGHYHCLVCGAGIGSGEAAYHAGNRWLCKYCYDHFLTTDEAARG